MYNISRKEREHMAREQEIVDAARNIFEQKGYDAVSMNEIAQEAQFTRKTLYQYFTNKAELYLAVAMQGFRLLYSEIQNGIKQDLSGYEKFYQMGLSYYQFYKKHPVLFKLMNEVGRIINKDMVDRTKFNELDDQIFNSVIQIVDEGKSDGSIRSDLDTKETVYSVIFLITGFLYEISFTGKTYTANFSLNEEKFIYNTLNLILGAFKAPE